MNLDRDEAEYHSIVLTNGKPNRKSGFKKAVEKFLKDHLGDSYYVEYVYSIGENISNINKCLSHVEKHFGDIDNSTTFNIKKSNWNDQKIVFMSWKNKNRALNRIFG